jgi:hypothetical protein
LIDQSGKLDTKVSDLNLLFPKHKIRSLPFNQGLKPLDDHMKVKQQVKEYGDNENKSAKRTSKSDQLLCVYVSNL